MALDLAHDLIDRLAVAPGVRQLRRAKFDHVFEHNPGMNLFRGVFDSYDEAAASIPRERRSGYDSDDAANLYVTWLDIFDWDYPPLFWIQRSFVDGYRSVCDLGGNIGIKYVAFRKLAAFPDDLAWTVVDVPAVCARGRKLADEHGVSSQLKFSDSPSTIDGHDVLFASGSLQYIPRTLSEMLRDVKQLPKRIILNLTPIHPSRTFYTVNSFGPGFSAYRVQDRVSFVRDLEALGYTQRGEWKNLGKPLELPFDDGLSLDHYTGFCFDRT